MALATWWNGDPLPDLPTLPSFSLSLSSNVHHIAHITTLSHQAIDARLQDNNHIYLAFLGHFPVAYGWVAHRSAGVNEIHLSFTLPSHNCYLWDFLTLPPWRGRGIYPHFLQAIIRQEQHKINRFWIMSSPTNDTAARSISRAGFHFVGELTLTQGYASGITLFHPSERAYAGAAVLGLPVYG